MLKRVVARSILERAIKAHEDKRWVLAHTFGYPGRDITWTDYVEQTPDHIWHLIACEYRCCERLKKLLDKYK